jgi:hypothetical protein
MFKKTTYSFLYVVKEFAIVPFRYQTLKHFYSMNI